MLEKVIGGEVEGGLDMAKKKKVKWRIKNLQGALKENKKK